MNDQLSMQATTMPEGEALAALPKAQADHYILAHMNASSDGRTYQQVSGEFLALDDTAKASAEGQALGGLRQTLFMGSTLRGLLLYGYAFATIGTVAGYAAIAAFAAALALALVLLGLRHARAADADVQVRGVELATA